MVFELLGLGEHATISFFFILAVVFGVLKLSNVFKNNAVHAVVALAVAAFVATQLSFVEMLWNYLSGITWFFIVMFFIAFALELFGVRKARPGEGEQKAMEGMIVGGAVLFILLSVGWMLLRTFPVNLPLIGGGENLIFLLGLVFVISLFWGAMKSGGLSPPAKPQGQG